MGSLIGTTKTAASKLGLTLEQYQEKIQQGLKWCFLGKHWRSMDAYHADKSRGDGLKSSCKVCAYQKKQRKDELVPDSSVIQQAASNAVRTAVRQGKLPKVTTLQCKCGNGARHYHHTKGYTEEHWLDVEPLCISCHRNAHWESRDGNND